mgnify:FL=1
MNIGQTPYEARSSAACFGQPVLSCRPNSETKRSVVGG